MSSSYYRNLIQTVLNASYADCWEKAVREWKIVDCEEDEECSSYCICGKENIRFLYTIHNVITGRRLFPIGSSCIRKFKRDDFNDEIKVLEEMYRLCHAIENGERIELTSKYFSRRLLEALYEEGAFKPSQYNFHNGENDYRFMLQMFNKRDKSSITERQKSKIRGIIAYSIKPFLLRKLKMRGRL